jgi:hypothetical protein
VPLCLDESHGIILPPKSAVVEDALAPVSSIIIVDAHVENWS